MSSDYFNQLKNNDNSYNVGEKNINLSFCNDSMACSMSLGGCFSKMFFTLVHIFPGNSGERNASENSLLIVVGLIPLQESQSMPRSSGPELLPPSV